ncbi:MAG: RNA-binding transcriptional accessory protein [Candidatus Omnitrophica bacterium]|nr:RNA-binding transcriptional accessory protein [Candidatus Omnitrophota bacterium]
MNNPLHIVKVSQELKLREKQVVSVAVLLDEGSTVPFIARYRKENTDGLDEVAITAIRDRLEQMKELDERRGVVLETIHKQGKLTDELKAKVEAAQTMTVLEDLYLPYKPKRRTRATIAKERGLEPLAQMIFEQKDGVDPRKEAEAYVSEEKQVKSVDEALAGARDIIAEWINEDAPARAKIRQFYLEQALFDSKVIKAKEEEGVKFKDYYDWQESVKTAPSHRVLAMRRGEKEEVLTLRVRVEEETAIALLEEIFVKADNLSASQVQMAVEDGFKRLLAMSMETEIRLLTKQKADEEAIRVFVENLRQLLMAAPLGQKNVLAVDPGFRTGAKVVCLTAQGKLVHNTVIYVTHSDDQKEQAAATIKKLCALFNIECIAIGNGTASRETEQFIRSLKLPNIQVVMVNESGASIYSASDVARQEFPDHDVTVRGAVSIGRRLQDPLAELVKIDPKSIGVGQYQHDVDQNLLKKSLDDVVISCVNQVGVEVNSASKELLMYVSGVGPALAKAIVEYRNEHDAFASREDFKKVPRLSAKIFEQAAGFLRVRGGSNPLDSSAVHPESYWVVDQMAKDLGLQVKTLLDDEKARKQIQASKYVSDKIGLPTLVDIINELAKPGRDPRAMFDPVQFKDDVQGMDDLKSGMKLPGIVTNVTKFGAFVDIGVHQDGLVHISEISDRFISDPSEIIKVGQKVEVTVIEVDLARKRISLSMRSKPRDPSVAGASKPMTLPGKPSSPAAVSSSGKVVINSVFDAPKKRKPLYDF